MPFRLLIIFALALPVGCMPRTVAKTPAPKKVAAKPVPQFTENELLLIKEFEEGNPLLNPRTIRTDDIGVFLEPVLVTQVLGDRAFMGLVGGQKILFVDVDTTDVPDGRIFDMEGLAFRCIGTTSYVDTTDARRTVMTVRAFNHRRALAEVDRREKLQKAEGESLELSGTDSTP